MKLFSPKNESYLGLDIGTSSIKLVELRNEKNRPRLSTYGYMDVETDIIKSDSKEAQARIAGSLKKIVKEARVTTNKTVSALPGFAVFSSIISLPQMSKKELVSAVKWEAKKFVPMPLDEMILDWKVLEKINIKPMPPNAFKQKKKEEVSGDDDDNKKTEQKFENADTADKKDDNKKETDEFKMPDGNKNKVIDVLLTAAPKNLVQRYINIMKVAGLELVSLETESFAAERSLVGNDPAPVLIVDVGAVATDITVIIDKVPILNRSIDIGGDSMTGAIQRSLGVDKTRAEQFKRDFGLLQPEGQASSAGIPKSLEFVLHSIVNEIRYIMNLYQNQEDRPIEKIVLSGGTAFVPGLTEFLGKELDMKVFVGDPWARVVYPVELKPVLQEIGPRFAIAVGLAMREIVS